MYKALGVFLIVLSCIWGFGALAVYSDNFSNVFLTGLNFLGCIAAIVYGIFLLNKPKKLRKIERPTSCF